MTMDTRQRDDRNGDTPPDGALARHESDIRGLRLEVASNTLAIKNLETMQGGVMGELGRLSGKVDDLTHRMATVPPPPPAHRTPLDSKVDVRELAEAIKDAAIKGEKDPHMTPEQAIEPVIHRYIERQMSSRIVRVLMWIAGLAITAWVTAEVTLLTTKGH
jgi:hypothetical protein